MFFEVGYLFYRYKPLLWKAVDNEDEEEYVLRFKVKCHPSRIPTELHAQLSNGDIVVNGTSVDALEAPGTFIVPILHVFGVWFLQVSRGDSVRVFKQNFMANIENVLLHKKMFQTHLE